MHELLETSVYEAKVYRVMIATPSDVPSERQVVREAVHYWNTILADERKVVLLPVGWETHAHPFMGERPQATINRKVLRDCDLLIAVFWTRLGSPTGAAASGTVEEIEEHLKSGKPAMIYFSNAPVRPDSIDEAQYRALREFRTDCEHRGLIETFESVSELGEKVQRHLVQLVLDLWAKGSTASLQASTAAATLARQQPELSPDAQALLRGAVEEPNGTVLRVRTMGGTSVQAGRKNFAEMGNSRSEAQWESALEELVAAALLQDRGSKGEVFGVTHKGYEVADRSQ
ncbi:DUF4062 domain-containing protein [Luteitalea sp.]